LNFLFVFLGGGLGSCARYGVSRLLSPQPGAFPFATLIANFLACLLLGYLISLVATDRLSATYRLLLLTGFCGGFSTFSTFSAELLDLLSSGRLVLALSYAFISLASGIGVIYFLVSK
jgi:CrcB protein